MKPRILLYGPPKIGKSTWASRASSPYFVTTDNGIDKINAKQTTLLNSWNEIVAAVERVANGEIECETVVLDTVNGASELCAQYICDTVFGGVWTTKTGTSGFMAWGQGWDAVAEEMKKLVNLLEKCRTVGKTIILLAHDGTQTMQSPTEGKYSKMCPDLSKRVWGVFRKWVDMILRADYEHIITEDRDGTVKVIGSSERIVRTEGSTSEDAGCNSGYILPKKLPLLYAAFAHELEQGSKISVERDDAIDVVVTAYYTLPAAAGQKILDRLGISGIGSVYDADPIATIELAKKISQMADRNE